MFFGLLGSQGDSTAQYKVESTEAAALHLVEIRILLNYKKDSRVAARVRADTTQGIHRLRRGPARGGGFDKPAVALGALFCLATELRNVLCQLFARTLR